MPRHFRLTKVHHTMRRVSLLMQVLGKQKSWRVLLVGVLAVVGFSYLVTVVSLSTHGYRMRDLEKNIDILKWENKKLNLEIAEAQSPARIAEWVKNSDMVAVSHVQYISSTTGVVASR